jgi:electron transport complex protein RnfB
MTVATAAAILALLPQTQCTRCGYPDCAGYAEAVAAGLADINQCPPGGQAGIERLAALTGRPATPLNPLHGTEGPRHVAVIDENWCIGCTLCIKVCPTDAILGSNKRMHSVIEPYCTGCALCLPVCPVDCISLEIVSPKRSGWAAWSQPQADLARERYAFHSERSRLDKAETEKKLEDKAREVLADLPAHSQHTDPAVLAQKRAVIEAALALARERRATARSTGSG